jgi:cytochrome c oxidase cbb3-type subunit 3
MNKKSDNPDGIELRPHTYDGIQEFDQRLPNWWLFTLYGAMVFSAAYWAYYHWTDHMKPGFVRVENQIAEIQKAALASGAAPTDLQLWQLSQNPDAVAAGKENYTTNCVACHGADLKGGIGFNLADNEWIHGGTPVEIYNTLVAGVTEKGMPAWGAILGPSRIADVVAYLISENKTIEEPKEPTPAM